LFDSYHKHENFQGNYWPKEVDMTENEKSQNSVGLYKIKYHVKCVQDGVKR